VAPRLIADRYQLLREVSRAPDATYWQAADTRLDREVMLELMRPELADDPAAVERFRDALRVSARGGGGQYGRLLDGGTDRDRRVPFAVFEWAEAPGADAVEPAQVASSGRGSVPRARARAIAPEAQAKRRSQPSHSSRNWVLPVVLTCLPLAVGIIVVSRVLSAPSPPVANVFAVPTGTVLVSNPIATAPPPTPVVAPTATAERPIVATTTPSPRSIVITPTPAGGGERVRIANTDGQGVALRDAPGGQRQPGKGYDEGVTVTVLERQGEWTHIRGDDGREGWVLSVTVPPAGSAPVQVAPSPSATSR
jgi:hypothetical protein